MAFSGDHADIAALRALIDDYCDAVFRRDSADWGACWAEESRWLLMGAEVSGRAAIVALWEQAMAGFSFVAFFAQPGSLFVAGDRATGRVWTHEVLKDNAGKLTRPVGRYDDSYVRTAGGWRFAERRYTLLEGQE